MSYVSSPNAPYRYLPIYNKFNTCNNILNEQSIYTSKNDAIYIYTSRVKKISQIFFFWNLKIWRLKKNHNILAKILNYKYDTLTTHILVLFDLFENNTKGWTVLLQNIKSHVIKNLSECIVLFLKRNKSTNRFLFLFLFFIQDRNSTLV